MKLYNDAQLAWEKCSSCGTKKSEYILDLRSGNVRFCGECLKKVKRMRMPKNMEIVTA